MEIETFKGFINQCYKSKKFADTPLADFIHDAQFDSDFPNLDKWESSWELYEKYLVLRRAIPEAIPEALSAARTVYIRWHEAIGFSESMKSAKRNKPMVTYLKTSDEELEIKIGRYLVAQFTDCGNGMEGRIDEGDNTRMTTGDLIALSRWLLSKASDREERQ